MTDVEDRLDDLEQRVQQLEDFQRQRDGDIQVGDTARVVITDANQDEDKDPFARIDGQATFVRCPDGFEPEFGDDVRVRIADVSDRTIVAVALPDA